MTHAAIAATAALPWTQRLLQQPWLDGAALNFFLEELNPRWSLLESRAQVLQVINETHDTKSFVLTPGWAWPRYAAGQHVGVQVEINGTTYRRRYSISSAPAGRREQFTITVKREPGGRVSNWLHDHVMAGHVLPLAAPAGDFVLPKGEIGPLLMLAAGSGITPLMGQLRSLLNQGHTGSIEFVHYVRNAQDRIFAEALQELADQHPNLRVQWCLESATEQAGPERFSAAQIAARVADYAQRHTMLCGPAGFMAAVRSHWDEQQLNAKLQFEYFGVVAELKPLPRAAGTAAAAQLARSGKSINVAAGQSLLLALEAAGESPAYGCRQGICQSCKCRKTSGQVRNLISGKVSRDPEEDIQLCISVAESDVVLDY